MIDKRPMPNSGAPADDLVVKAVSEVEAVLSVLRRPGGPSDPPSLDELCERYQRVGEPRVGGFGLVWEAYDERTERRVAVKEPRPDRPRAVAVLAHEAAVLSRLQHPNIVPLFDLVPGDSAGRPPVYVMPFLDGPTLREHAAAFHAARPAVAREALLPLLRPFLDVCRAVQHAHDSGWLHLDIKGSNVKLGPTGEAVLLDWGLAREQGAGPTAGAAGTPTHMAPEQAAAAGVDRQTDVHGLGALLYELLTGRPPFDTQAGKTSGLDGRLPDPPHAHWPAVPPPLEAVCLKALAGRPVDRYPSADAVRTEVERWLGRDRVEAYPEPWAERLTRVLVRHRGPVATAAVGLVLALAVAVAGLVQVSAARSETEARRQEAIQSLAREQAGLRDALRSGDRLFAAFDPRLYSDFDPRVPHRDFPAAEAIRHYENLIARHRDNAAVAHEVVNARLRLGRLLRILGQVDRAEVELRAALLILAAHPPEDRAEAELLRAEAEAVLGRVCYELGRWDEGDALLARAIGALAGRAGDGPDGRECRAVYASALSHRTWGLWVRGRLSEALRDSELCDGLIATDPTPGRVLWAAISRCTTAHLHRELGRPAEAERLFAGIQDDLRPLMDDPFHRFQAGRWLATALNGRGLALRDLGREPEAVEQFRAAYRSRSEWLTANPAHRRLAQEVAASALNLAALLSGIGEHAEAAGLAREAVDLLEARLREVPNQVVVRQQLQGAHRRAADIAAAAGRPADAARHRERTAELDPPKK